MKVVQGKKISSLIHDSMTLRFRMFACMTSHCQMIKKLQTKEPISSIMWSMHLITPYVTKNRVQLTYIAHTKALHAW
jgi:hypothetical protein